MKKILQEHASCSYSRGGPSHTIKVTKSVEPIKGVVVRPDDWYEDHGTDQAKPGKGPIPPITRTEYQYRWHLSIGSWEGAYETPLTPITTRYLIDALSRTLEDMESIQDKPAFGAYLNKDARCSVYRRAGSPSGPNPGDDIQYVAKAVKFQASPTLEPTTPKGNTAVVIYQTRKGQVVVDVENGSPTERYVVIDDGQGGPHPSLIRNS